MADEPKPSETGTESAAAPAAKAKKAEAITRREFNWLALAWSFFAASAAAGLTAMGRFNEAEDAMRTAQQLDPLSLIANAALGWVYFHAGRFDDAVAQCQRTLALDLDAAGMN